MGFPLSEVWLDEIDIREFTDQLFKTDTCALRLALGNGSAFDLYISYHHHDQANHVLVIAPEGFPAAVLDMNRGPFCMPKRFKGLPDTDAVGLAYFATMLRFQYTVLVDANLESWESYIAGEEFQDAIRELLPPWTQYDRRPAGVPEWVANLRQTPEGE